MVLYTRKENGKKIVEVFMAWNIESHYSSQCISDILDSELAFSINSLPHLNKLVNNTRFNSTDFQFLTFREFLKTCRMIYDYIHQRIIIHTPSCTYAYLYSMDSKQWGMMHSNIYAVVFKLTAMT